MSVPPVEPKSVLITGCSSGIGLASALYLRDRGWTVFPTARRKEDLDMLAGHGFEPITLDVGDEASVADAARVALDRCSNTLGAVVNNAGVAQYGAVEDLTRDALRRQFEVNVFGMQQLTNLLLPVFRERGRGRIVHVSSVYGRISAPMVGAYCASKHAMEALADSMRVELHGTGVALSLIEPGPIETEFRRNAATQSFDHLEAGKGRFRKKYEKSLHRSQEKAGKPKPFSAPPVAVAKKIAHALESSRPKRRYCVTLPAYLGAFMRRFAPDALLDLLLKNSART